MAQLTVYQRGALKLIRERGGSLTLRPGETPIETIRVYQRLAERGFLDEVHDEGQGVTYRIRKPAHGFRRGQRVIWTPAARRDADEPKQVEAFVVKATGQRVQILVRVPGELAETCWVSPDRLQLKEGPR